MKAFSGYSHRGIFSGSASGRSRGTSERQRKDSKPTSFYSSNPDTVLEDAREGMGRDIEKANDVVGGKCLDESCKDGIMLVQLNVERNEDRGVERDMESASIEEIGVAVEMGMERPDKSPVLLRDTDKTRVGIGVAVFDEEEEVKI
jgi:hypothetical protein